MRLQRVQIPNFRVLKDIDITFEENCVPQIFPLASQNGGGKSTFLQLVFTLLTYYNNEVQQELIKNLIDNAHIKPVNGRFRLAEITFTDNGNKNRTLDFFLCDYSTLHEIMVTAIGNSHNGSKQELLEKYGVKGLRQEISKRQRNIESISKQQKSIEGSFNSYIEFTESWASKEFRRQINIETLELAHLNEFMAQTHSVLSSRGIKIIYLRDEDVLLCNTHDNIEDPNQNPVDVFLVAPSSQVFLFLAEQKLAHLFSNPSEYYQSLQEMQTSIHNVFLYEFSIVKILTDSFKKAFEHDMVQAIKSGGKYGREYESLLNHLENFLDGKTIQPSEDISRIVFKRIENGQEVELSPADLSHGELRRLAFYAWLKTNQIKNSIVLIDEIEIGLHPDWQYRIVRDLEEWEPSNQYILATHSYEVCSALSPAHVKEIEPKLAQVDGDR
jgi:predicted ATP-dependent endonuclease of OLD family